ncbi:MAG: helix-turn-helix domain-containing protein [Deltaproteobacteria bacterium]|nr:helix-turn-helix domain-containing protein [Deltaproteobacteria bacterium]MBW2069761.1 helix-turn-helix domain-containing protein [Deltaproteobacteria bacterium]
MANPTRKGAKSEAEIEAEARRKKEILDKVAQSNLPTKTILKELGISRSTYYSWLKRFEEHGMEGLKDSRSSPKSTETEEKAAAGPTEVESVAEQAAEEDSVIDSAKATAESPTKFTTETEQTRPTEPAEPVAYDVESHGATAREEMGMSGQGGQISGSEQKKGMGVYALIAIFLLVVGFLVIISFSNSNSYRLKVEDNKITLWKGKFAPRGMAKVDSFEPVAIGDADVSPLLHKSYVGKEAVYKALFGFFMQQIDAESTKGDNADIARMAQLLEKAEAISTNGGSSGKQAVATLYQLAEKRVAVAEMALQNAYRKALPAYQKALRYGLGDPSAIKARIDTMEVALGLKAPPKKKELPEAAAPAVEEKIEEQAPGQGHAGHHMQSEKTEKPAAAEGSAEHK